MRFVRTELGKSMPIDATPDPDGQWVIEAKDVGGKSVETLVMHWPLIHRGRERYTSHFATCEHADRHRKARESSATAASAHKRKARTKNGG